MWLVIKFDRKKLCYLKNGLKEKFGSEGIIYAPKILIKKLKNNKVEKKELNILGNYLFCYHKKFEKISFLKQLNFIKGVKYFLNGFQTSQQEIKDFIERCKGLEDQTGYISNSLYQEQINNYYKFSTGPFIDKIFKIINLKKNEIDILMGNLNTTFKKKSFYLFRLKFICRI